MTERDRTRDTVEYPPDRVVRPAMRDYIDMRRMRRETEREPDAARDFV
jgi:hypothetical protein